MSTYKLGQDGGTVIETGNDGQVWQFPIWDHNGPDPPSQRQGLYAAWLAAGNTPAPAVPAPLVYASSTPVEGRVRTTDATPTEVYRRTLAPLTGYAAILGLLGVDAGNGAVRMIRASVVAKRLGSGAVLVGAPVVIANHQDTGAATWAIAATVSGNDVVISVTGAAGRTIDWLLNGEVRSFTPAGA
jgi:hypothetical protein